MQTIALPTVYQSVTTQTPGTSGVISAGNGLTITANSLSNRGGQISALNGVALNVQSLSNGAVAPLLSNQVNTWVDQASFPHSWRSWHRYRPQSNHRLSDPVSIALAATSLRRITRSIRGGGSYSVRYGHHQHATRHDRRWRQSHRQRGNLVNEGILYAGNNVVINAASLTNQGGNQQNYSSQVGCASVCRIPLAVPLEIRVATIRTPIRSAIASRTPRSMRDTISSLPQDRSTILTAT